MLAFRMGYQWGSNGKDKNQKNSWTFHSGWNKKWTLSFSYINILIYIDPHITLHCPGYISLSVSRCSNKGLVHQYENLLIATFCKVSVIIILTLYSEKPTSQQAIKFEIGSKWRLSAGAGAACAQPNDMCKFDFVFMKIILKSLHANG